MFSTAGRFVVDTSRADCEPLPGILVGIVPDRLAVERPHDGRAVRPLVDDVAGRAHEQHLQLLLPVLGEPGHRDGLAAKPAGITSPRSASMIPTRLRFGK